MDLSFMAAGRRRSLTRRQPGGAFHIRVQINGKDILRSLGTTVIATAKEKAKQIIEAEQTGDVETSRRLKVKSDYSTLQEICDIYREQFGTNDQRQRTANGNIGCLAKVLRIAGINGSLENIRSSVLTSQVVRDFETNELKRIKRDGRGHMQPDSERQVRESLSSTLTQARSIFKPGTISWFESLALPNLDEFRQQAVTQPRRPKPRPLDQAAIEQMNAAAPQLAKTDPPCYIAHLLFKYLGMRNREQKFAKRSWIVRDNAGAGQLGVIDRPEEGFFPKKSERWIAISAGVLAELDKHWSPSPDGDYLVPAANKTEREEVIDDRHNDWARQWIQGHIKVSYELRRYAGNLIYDKTGRIEDVRDFLGHTDLETTLQWYFWKRRNIPAIDLKDCPSTPAAFTVVA